MRRVGPLLLGMMLALFTTLAGMAPAQAHDYLVSSQPAPGAILEMPPEQVNLEFNTSIGKQFAQVAVVGSDGVSYQDGTPLVDGPTVTQAVAAIPAGTEVVISYRVVSSDGHPIGGTVPFAIADGAPTQDPSGDPPATGSPAVQTEPTPTTDPGAADATSPAALTSDSGSGGMTAWVMLAGATVIASIIGVGIVLARRAG